MNAVAVGIKQFLQDEEGSNAIEYALIAALIAVVLIVGATAVGVEINALFTRIATCLQTNGVTC